MIPQRLVLSGNGIIHCFHVYHNLGIFTVAWHYSRFIPLVETPVKKEPHIHRKLSASQFITHRSW